MPVIFICLGVALYRLLERRQQALGAADARFVLVSAAVGFLDTLNNIAA